LKKFLKKKKKRGKTSKLSRPKKKKTLPFQHAEGDFSTSMNLGGHGGGGTGLSPRGFLYLKKRTNGDIKEEKGRAPGPGNPLRSYRTPLKEQENDKREDIKGGKMWKETQLEKKEIPFLVKVRKNEKQHQLGEKTMGKRKRRPLEKKPSLCPPTGRKGFRIR